VRTLQPGADRILLSGGGTPNALVTATDPDQDIRRTTSNSRGSWSLDLAVDKGRNDFTIITTDPETARESEPLRVIANVPVLENAIGTGTDAPALPDGVEASEITGVPSAQVKLTSPLSGLQSASGKVKVEGTSDAEEVTVSFQWRGNVDNAKNAPPPSTLPVEEGVFRGTFQLPKGRWQVSVAAAINGGAPDIESVPVKSLSDKMLLKIEAVDGGTRIKVTNADGEVIAERIRLDEGEKWTRRVDPDVTLRVGNARAAHVTVDGVELGRMGSGSGAKTWRIKQGEKPKTIS
jgi:hypothetical protein